MKKTLIALAFAALPAAAQTDWFNAQLEFRFDYDIKTVDNKKTDSGFKGQYLNLKLNGDISEHFSYAYRQRFSKDMRRNGGYLDATDFIYLNYHPNDRWNFSAGKQFVAIGGYEYDYAPIDVYQYSEYCNHIYCYGYGVSADYNATKHDNLLLQVSQSAFANHDRDYYAYNFRWVGHHGFFNSIYSVNMQEYAKGKYMNIIALGNQLDYSHGHVLVDFTNRYAKVNNAKFFGDFTMNAEVHYKPIEALNLYARYCIDHNADNTADITVRPNTTIHTVGGGIEYFPLKDDEDIRLHLGVYHNFGENGNTEDPVLLDNMNYISVGLIWRANVNKIKDRIHAKRQSRQ